MAADLSQDIAELRALLSQASRPRIQALLTREILNLEKSAASLDPAPLKTVAATPEIRFTTLSNFSWEQDGEKVKIYIPLEGASDENIKSDFQPWSFGLKIHDVDGKNYRCGVQKLNNAILPEKSTVSVKPKRIIVTLKKAERSDWKELYFKEDKKPKLDSGKDPMSGLMDMMKNMYEEGDDEMKRTIAQAWSEAHAGKKPGMKRGF